METQEPSGDKLLDENFDAEKYRSGRRKVITLASCFLLVFSAFNSAQNLVGSIYSSQGYKSLGLVSLLTLYFVFAVSSLYANYFISKLPYKFIFVLSSLGYGSYCGAGIWVCACEDSTASICSETIIYIVVLFGAALCGYSASLIWIAQGGYINSIAMETPQKKGEFSGTFWAINQSSFIVGAIIGTFVLKYLSPLSYFLIMTGLILTGSMLFLIIPDAAKISGKDSEKIPIQQQVRNVFKLLVHRRTRYFLPVIMLSGIIVSFFSGFLSRIVRNSIDLDSMSEDDGNKEVSKKLSYTLICLGCFEVISGVLSGRLADKISVYKLATFGTLVTLLGIMMSFLGLFTGNYFVCFVVAAVWGFCDCLFQTIVQTIANKDFPGEIEIFQILRLVLSVTCAIFFIINLLLQNSPPYIFVMIVMGFGLFVNFCCSQLDQDKEKKNSLTSANSE